MNIAMINMELNHRSTYHIAELQTYFLYCKKKIFCSLERRPVTSMYYGLCELVETHIEVMHWFLIQYHLSFIMYHFLLNNKGSCSATEWWPEVTKRMTQGHSLSLSLSERASSENLWILLAKTFVLFDWNTYVYNKYCLASFWEKKNRLRWQVYNKLGAVSLYMFSYSDVTHVLCVSSIWTYAHCLCVCILVYTYEDSWLPVLCCMCVYNRSGLRSMKLLTILLMSLLIIYKPIIVSVPFCRILMTALIWAKSTWRRTAGGKRNLSDHAQ